MRIVVVLKQIPDVVEELELTADGVDVDREMLKLVLNEFDDQALEEALCLKESNDAEVVAVSFDEPGADVTLHTALAKGADAAVKLVGAGEGWLDGHRRSAMLASWLAQQTFDLVLTGVQAADDLDGQLPALLGARLEVPHCSVVVRVDVDGGTATVRQELAGGAVSEEEVVLPAVIGMQAARQAPRYVAMSRIRQVQQAGGIEQAAVTDPGPLTGAGFRLVRLSMPEVTGHADMIGGSPAEVADRIVELMRAKGVVPS